MVITGTSKITAMTIIITVIMNMNSALRPCLPARPAKSRRAGRRRKLDWSAVASAKAEAKARETDKALTEILEKLGV